MNEEQKGLVILKKTENVNGCITTTYDNEGTIREALQKRYTNQGELYHQLFGVSEETARNAEWHPSHREFTQEYCEGWAKFLRDGGWINKIITTVEIDIKKYINGLFEKASK